MRRAKITISGGGNVGASWALWAASKELGDIVVLDIPAVADTVKGKMLDLAQCGPVERFDTTILGTAAALVLGAGDAGTDRFLDGVIDEVRISQTIRYTATFPAPPLPPDPTQPPDGNIPPYTED